MSAEPEPVVLRSVAAPPALLYASPSMVKAEAAICCIVGVLSGEPLLAMVLFVALHPVAILLTRKDPHMVEALQARLRCRRTRNLRPTKGKNRYVP